MDGTLTDQVADLMENPVAAPDPEILTRAARPLAALTAAGVRLPPAADLARGLAALTLLHREAVNAISRGEPADLGAAAAELDDFALLAGGFAGLYVLAAAAEQSGHPGAGEDVAAERDHLRRFKAWVHEYLDAQGVPHHPPGSHGAAGCRIGDRMDWLMTHVPMPVRVGWLTRAVRPEKEFPRVPEKSVTGA